MRSAIKQSLCVFFHFPTTVMSSPSTLQQAAGRIASQLQRIIPSCSLQTAALPSDRLTRVMALTKSCSPSSSDNIAPQTSNGAPRYRTTSFELTRRPRYSKPSATIALRGSCHAWAPRRPSLHILDCDRSSSKWRRESTLNSNPIVLSVCEAARFTSWCLRSNVNASSRNLSLLSCFGRWHT
jgi:hypothetical protein